MDATTNTAVTIPSSPAARSVNMRVTLTSPNDPGTTSQKLGRNVTIAGGPAPARAYIEELLPDVLEGTIAPGRVFDSVIGLDDVPDGYRAMNDREALKVLIEP